MKSGLLGSAVFLPSLSMSCKSNTGIDHDDFYTPIRRKVMMVMLSTQKQNWEHGIACQAFVETGDETMMILMAKEAVLRQGDDGRLAVISVAAGINDSATPLEAVLRSYEILGDPELKKASDRMIKYLFEKAPRTEKGYIHHSYHGPELWADTIFMGAPFIAFAGYPEEAVKQVRGIREQLWIEEESLFAYRYNADLNEITNPKLWGLANAHALNGMAMLTERLPGNMATEIEEMKDYTRKHLDGCLNYIREDFLFHDTINDPSTFVETSLAMRVAHTIFKGVNAGWLDEHYLETAGNIRKAVYEKIDDLGNVMGVPGSPDYSDPGRSTEGQAFFLMMEAAFENLGEEHTRLIPA